MGLGDGVERREDATGHLVGGLAVAPVAGAGVGEPSQDLRVGQTLPRAEMPLAQVGPEDDLSRVALRHDPRGVARARQIARVDRVEPLGCELVGERLGLGPSRVVQRRVGVPLHAPVAVPVGLAVSREQDRRRGHSSRLAPWISGSQGRWPS